MAIPKAAKPKVQRDTPMAEWMAASLGLVLTLAVVGYSLWEGLTHDTGPPDLSVSRRAAQVTTGGFVVPIVVRNAGYATAAQVEVRGTLEQGGRVIEERRAVFAYVPGRGETEGGLVFQQDPRAYDVSLAAEGYEKP